MIPADSNILRTQPKPECPLCTASGELLYKEMEDRLFDVPGQWSLKRCPGDACGYVWLDPMPIEEDLHKAYSNYYTHEVVEGPPKTALRRIYAAICAGYLSRRYGYRTANPSKWESAGVLMNLMPGRRANLDFSVLYTPAVHGGRLVDVGCGSGILLSNLAEKGWDVTGVDFDPGGVSAARERGLNVHQGSLDEQRFPDGSFDAVLMSHVIEHVPDPTALLREAHRILAPGGRLVVVTPNTGAFAHRYFKADWLHLDPPRHLHLFNPATLQSVARQAGFTGAELRTTLRDAKGAIATSRIIRKFRTHAWKRGLSRWDRVVGSGLQSVEWLQLLAGRPAGEELVLISKKQNQAELETT